MITNKIANKLPSCTFKKDSIKIPSNITLADSHFNITQTIDMLIGTENFYSSLKFKRIVQKGHPILQDTNFTTTTYQRALFLKLR